MRTGRREFVRVLAVTGAVGAAGCLGSAGSGGGSEPEDVVLPSPERGVDSEDLPYLAWGEPLPDVTLPAPLADDSVTLSEIETPALLTYFYSHCMTVCPALVSSLRNVQTHATNEGYADQVAFYPITFDPARDDAATLEEYGRQMNVDYEAGNWQFLRPETEERAKAVVQEEFGVMFKKQWPEEGDENATSSGDDHEGDDYMFMHTPMVTLVNGRGYVERGYRTDAPDVETILADLETVRQA